MAANDYYNSAYSSQPLQHRNDNPLPPLPGAQSTHSVSPVTSPFDTPFDEHHRYEHPLSQSHSAYHDTSYHGASSQPQHYNNDSSSNIHSTDPFADQNAIPLRSHGKMDSSPTRYVQDPEATEDPRRYGEREKRRKKGWFSGRITWVVFILTTVQIGVFVGEIIKNAMLTRSPIEVKPQFNPMIGPSPYVLINMGARYTPCMHSIAGITNRTDLNWNCPNTTDTVAGQVCSLSEQCGFGGISGTPNQWWRFIVPMFLHAGIVHIGFNMLLQLTLGRDMEKEIGPIRFALVYFSSGIFGFVLGGNYAAPAIASTGASGSLFGVLALVLLDLLYDWKNRPSPVKDLLFLLLDIAISFVLGLLPGLDNFSHIGGFLMGLVLGICLLRSPTALRERIGLDEPPYTSVGTESGPGLQKFVKQPVGFFKGRKPFWWAWWLIRAGALVAVFIGFILLLKNFYVWRNTCSWCHHLSCLPIKNWCNVGNFNITEKPAGSKRDMSMLQPIDLAAMAAEVMLR